MQTTKEPSAFFVWIEIKLNLQLSKSDGLCSFLQSTLKLIRIVDDAEYFSKTVENIL